MSIDFLPLLLAAAMPVIVFAGYAVLRARRERADRNARPTRQVPTADGPAAAGNQVPTAPSDVDAIRSESHAGASGLLRKVRAAHPGEASSALASGHESPTGEANPTAPATSVAQASIDSPPREATYTADIIPTTEVRREEWSFTDPAGAPRMREETSSLVRRIQKARLEAATHKTPRVETSNGEGPVESGGMARRFATIWALFGVGSAPSRGGSDGTAPTIEAGRPFATSDSADPCPACEESRSRGWRYCRRCGRPVDFRAPAPRSLLGSGRPMQGPLAMPSRRRGGLEPSATNGTALVQAVTALSDRSGGGVGLPLPNVLPTPEVATAERSSDASSMASPGSDRILPGEADDEEVASTPGQSADSAAEKESVAATIDVNTATHAELVAVRGIGPATAKRILEARAERPFLTLDELAERRIVAEASLERYRPRLVVRAGTGHRSSVPRSSPWASNGTARSTRRPPLTPVPPEGAGSSDRGSGSRAHDHAD
jgi:competence protein ComEA